MAPRVADPGSNSLTLGRSDEALAPTVDIRRGNTSLTQPTTRGSLGSIRAVHFEWFKFSATVHPGIKKEELLVSILPPSESNWIPPVTSKARPKPLKHEEKVDEGSHPKRD